MITPAEPSGTSLQFYTKMFSSLNGLAVACEVSGTSTTITHPSGDLVSVTEIQISLTAEDKVFEFLNEQKGVRYQPRDISTFTEIKPATVHSALRRLLVDGKIRHDRREYFIPLPPHEVNPFQLAAAAVEISLPLEIGEYARVSQGDLVVIPGEKNAGKSAFLGETAILNMTNFHVNYIVTENIRKIARRFIQWGFSEADIMKHVSFIDARARDYGNIIKPDSLNILDYYNPSGGDYTKTAHEFEMMAAQLNSGVLVVGLQKAKNASFGRGGELSNELSQLTVSLEVVDYSMGNRIGKASLSIIKEAGIRKGGESKACEYTFSSVESGSRIVQTGFWDWPKRAKKNA